MLADDLRNAADAIESGRVSACTLVRLESAVQLVQRDQAAADAVELLDPGNRLTPWQAAGLLAASLSRFESTGWLRIRNGHRGPKNPLEGAFSTMLKCENCPRSQRRLFELLTAQRQ